MNTIRSKAPVLIVVLCCVWCIGVIDGHGDAQRQDKKAAREQHTVDEFLRQFVTLFRLTSRERNGFEMGQLDGNLDYSPVRPALLRPPPSSFGYGFGAQPAPSYLPPGFPPSPFEGYPPRPQFHRPYPPYPLNYRPLYANGYPQSSLFAALDSISRYDDLRCVPRLLCEVTTGSRSKYNRQGYLAQNNHDDSSPVPFLSRDALITLLTVLNFVDDSPLLSFARAAFLGYSSRGDLRACLTAYPTCPRDPDQLIDYLNNHNGGFFRFFNQQLQQQPQYAPQYQHFVQKYQQQQQQQQQHQQYDDQTQFSMTGAPITPRYADDSDQENRPNSRILNDPIDIQYVGDKISQYSVRKPKLIGEPNKVIFENADQMVEPQRYESVRQVYEPSNLGPRGTKFVFPEHRFGKYRMIFPNRTGTGNLILSSDVNGHLKVVFEDDELPDRNRTSKNIKFETEKSDGHRSKRKMRFPQEEEV